ncbi:hypothetical protein GCM10022252_47810 [Streptosporangium oxazolinicum]|uniref:Uncharacterized protein n=2 Tax=Streptosporangium oxazolinicum TaxID=909287 RepID=A0ABP8B4W8_9ACTN
MTHWGFDGRPRTGKMVINESVADQVVSVFRELYGQLLRWMDPKHSPQIDIRVA